MKIGKRIADKIAALSPAFDQIPGAVIIHYLNPSTVIYMNNYGLQRLNTTITELREMGGAYYERFFNPEDAAEYVPKVLGMIERNNDEELVSFFQQVRAKVEEEWQWHVCGTKLFMNDDDGNPFTTISVAIPIDKEHYYNNKLERLIEENFFLKKNSSLFATIGKREKQILKLMAQGISSSDMALQLYLSEETIKSHRRNIRKKLNAETHYDIVKFAQAFDLI